MPSFSNIFPIWGRDGESPADDDLTPNSVSTEAVDSEEYLQNGEPFEPGVATVSTEVPEVGDAGETWARLDDSDSEIWQYELYTDRVESVFEHNGVVYYSEADDETVIAADAEDGSEIWRHEFHTDRV